MGEAHVAGLSPDAALDKDHHPVQPGHPGAVAGVAIDHQAAELPLPWLAVIHPHSRPSWRHRSAPQRAGCSWRAGRRPGARTHTLRRAVKVVHLHRGGDGVPGERPLLHRRGQLAPLVQQGVHHPRPYGVGVGEEVGEVQLFPVTASNCSLSRKTAGGGASPRWTHTGPGRR